MFINLYDCEPSYSWKAYFFILNLGIKEAYKGLPPENCHVNYQCGTFHLKSNIR